MSFPQRPWTIDDRPHFREAVTPHRPEMCPAAGGVARQTGSGAAAPDPALVGSRPGAGPGAGGGTRSAHPHSLYPHEKHFTHPSM
mgnify:CR=1 FL=1